MSLPTIKLRWALKKIVLWAGGLDRSTQIEMTPDAITMSAPKQIELKAGNSKLTIATDAIQLKVGNNLLRLGARGLTVNAYQIATKAELNHVAKSALMKTDIKGIVQQVAAMTKEGS